jgi:hypothetical protein
MIYFGDTARDILSKNLYNNANIIGKGYFKDGDRWLAFDNDTCDCFVEEFEKQEHAIAWVGISGLEELKIFKLFRYLYYIPEEGFLIVKHEKKSSTISLKSRQLFNGLFRQLK